MSASQSLTEEASPVNELYKPSYVPEQDANASEGSIRDDAAIERKVLWKLDTHIMTLVFVLYLLSFLDRSNIGNARIAGMQKDLDLTGDKYQWLLNIFYIPYIVGEVQIMLYKFIPPHYMMTFTVFAWGVIATCQAATFSWAGEMACRFFLGLTEAGVPGIVYMLSFFYLRRELGFRCGLFVSAAPLATCFAGALAYGITSGHPAIASWRLLFLVEGLPTVILAPFCFFFLPDSPHQAKFLDAEEKRVALARVRRQVGSEKRIGRASWRDILMPFIDLKCWITALMYFSCNVSYASLPVFLPTILEEMGFSGVNAQGLSAPPYFASFLATLLTTWIADRTQQRGLVIIIMSIIGGVGYIMLATTTGTGPRYAGVYVAAVGIFPCIANVLPWVMNNQGNDTRRGIGMTIMMMIGQCGPLLGTNIYPANDGPRYVLGNSVCAAFMFFNGLLALSLRILLSWENRKLDRKYGTVEEQKAQLVESGQDMSQVTGIENYGPLYRYVL